MTHNYLTIGLCALALLAAPATQAGHNEDVRDMWSEARIVMNYTLDTTLNPFDIEVEVRDRTAYLSGTLPTAAEKAHAEQVALSIPGVDQVNNLIVLDKNVPHNEARRDDDQAVTDANITAMVKAQLLWNELTHALDIAVSVENGVVTLSGPVRSEQEAREAMRIADNTRLVQKVNNEMTVQGD